MVWEAAKAERPVEGQAGVEPVEKGLERRRLPARGLGGQQDAWRKKDGQKFLLFFKSPQIKPRVYFYTDFDDVFVDVAVARAADCAEGGEEEEGGQEDPRRRRLARHF